MSIESDIINSLTESRQWVDALITRATIAADPAVYAITTSERFGRLLGISDIIYIGCASKLGGPSDRARLYFYQYPPTPREKRIKKICADLLADDCQLTFRWRAVSTIHQARSLEATYLQQCLIEHRELPPLNHATPKLMTQSKAVVISGKVTSEL